MAGLEDVERGGVSGVRRVGAARGGRFSTAGLLSACLLSAGAVGLTGCEASPQPGVAQGQRPYGGAVSPSYRYEAPPEVLAAQGHEAAGMVDPVSAVRDQQTHLGSMAPPVVEGFADPDVAWLNVPGGAAAAPAADREVLRTSVKRLDERVDATGGGGLADAAPGADGGAAGNAEMNLDAGDAQGAEGDEGEGPGEAAPQPLYADATKLTQAELLAELRERLLGDDAPAVRRALSVSALSLADPTIALSDELSADLTPEQAELVQRYRTLLLEIAQRIDAGDVETLDAEEVARAVSGLTGPRPVTLRNAALCRRVSGFGVYEPFASHEFIAGQENRMIIYAEVEDFAVAPATTDGGRPGFAVSLEQEVVLYNEADGLAVWRHDPQPVQDVSRRQRRDFWVVQMVALPANLGVGKYRLKVRVSDLHGSTVDEATLPVRLIADESARTADGSVKPREEAAKEVMEAMRKLLSDEDDTGPLLQP